MATQWSYLYHTWNLCMYPIYASPKVVADQRIDHSQYELQTRCVK